MSDGPVLSADDYATALAEYLHDHSERALYRASMLSQHFIESGLGPEDIIALHFEALDQALAGHSYREQARMSGDAQQFLLEIMIAYGVRYKEYLELKLMEAMRDADARTARDRERLHEVERLERERGDLLQLVAHELRSPITAATGHLQLAERFLEQGRFPLPRLGPGGARAAFAPHRRPRGGHAGRRCRVAARAAGPGLGRQAGMRLGARRRTEQGDHLADGGTAVRRARHGQCRRAPERRRESPLQRCPLHAAGRPGGCAPGRGCGDRLDRGPGHRHRHHPGSPGRIFEKFWRAPDARQVDVRGLGLGLALVKQMTEAHEGQVTVASTFGAGSTFRVQLPRCIEHGEGEGDGPGA